MIALHTSLTGTNAHSTSEFQSLRGLGSSLKDIIHQNMDKELKEAQQIAFQER